VHIVFLCHILTTEVVKHDLHRFKQKNHVCSMISRTLSYEVKGEERWFRFWNMKSFKTHTKLPFGVTKKDARLVFHFHVSKMFKCWSKLGLTNIQMSIKNSKKNQKMKNLCT
jgi:hypothetical protein